MMGRLKFLIISCALLLMVACSKAEYSTSNNYYNTSDQLIMNNFIKLYAASGVVTINENKNIVGTVTTSDSSSNFHKSFIIDDGSAAIEIMCGFYDIYTNYKKGHRVRIYLNGLSFGQSDQGVYRLGLGSSSMYDIEYFYHRAIAEDYIEVVDTDDQIYVAEKTISEIGYDDIARTVRICDLMLCQEDGVEYWAQTEYGSDGRARFYDAYGDTITVNTSSYSSFANHPIPTEKVDITALVFWSGGNTKTGYYLKLNDEDAVNVQ